MLERNLLKAQVTSTRRKPFHMAVAAPDVSTGSDRAVLRYDVAALLRGTPPDTLR